jgi:hypothetical protein
MKSRTLLISLLAGAALFGCATTPRSDAMLTYESSPEGATIFEGGQALGVAPVTRTYNGDGKSDSIRTPEVTAVWPSGAKSTFWTQIPVGADRLATIERPQGAPGLQADLDAARPLIEKKRREAQREKEGTMRDMARDSARCREQMSKNNHASNDCS